MTATSRRDRLAAQVDKGFALLDDGDVDGATAALHRAQGIDRKDPDVRALEASVADAGDDPDRAIALFEELAAEDADAAMPLINAARVHLVSRTDPAAALAVIERALERVDEEPDLIEAITIKADALIALGGKARLAEARETLAELASSVIDEPLALSLAELWLDAGDPDRALALATSATRDADTAADAYHLIGGIHDDRGRGAERTAAWREVRRLDLAAPAPPWTLTHDAFDALAHAAFAELPARARELLGNCPILVEAMPSDDLIADGIDPRLLGLFSGTALPHEQSVGGAPSVTTIHLFQKNLEAAALDADDLAEQIRITVLHETAHFFGLDEDDLAAIGLE